ncbi:hypothetical protein CK203_024561 [Vitis vinifera]|uniref:Uncharacterized protein n=1 Tax=Vitis vinifera TaxID=29760 RepID=A0A438IU95_VITVI|nr:hypothetical protein CK203_080698 [Vitis vinifera]RVX00319.1 hypothetical protein CK203_024561 [Vitis vinifera]
MQVVEVVLSGSFQVLFGKLGSSDLWKFAHQEQVQTELKKWQKDTGKSMQF